MEKTKEIKNKKTGVMVTVPFFTILEMSDLTKKFKLAQSLSRLITDENGIQARNLLEIENDVAETKAGLQLQKDIMAGIKNKRNEMDTEIQRYAMGSHVYLDLVEIRTIYEKLEKVKGVKGKEKQRKKS